MKSTKEQILNTALRLFNNLGFSQVSLRDISDSMKISLGNLTYHFNKKETIVECLFANFIKEINGSINRIEESEKKLTTILGIIDFNTHTRVKYRFIVRDFMAITTLCPEIKKQFKKNIKQTKIKILMIFDDLVKDNFMLNPQLNDQHESLYERIHIIANFWISSVEMIDQKLTTQKIESSILMIQQIIYPYLTKKGENSWFEYHQKKIR